MSNSNRKCEHSFFFCGDFRQTTGGLGLSLISDHPTSAADTPARDVGGGGDGSTDGFVSCTESLGFESSDERIAGDGSVVARRGTQIGDCSMTWGRVRRRSAERRRVLELPPPLTSFDKNGRRSFILRPVRKDGRLELTEVKIHRPEIMSATRENGRLTLRLLETPDEEEEEEDDEIEAEEEEERTEKAGDYDLGESKGGGSDGCECRSPASDGEGEEALRRCCEYEIAGNQHLNVWSPRFVTTM